MLGVLVGWGLFVYGSFIPSVTILMSSIVVFGSSLLLFVAMGNFVETRSFIVKQAKHSQARLFDRLMSEDTYRDKEAGSGKSVGRNYSLS